MKITSIEAQKNKDRVNIFIDGKFAFGLSQDLRYKYNLKSNMTIDEYFIKDILKKEEEKKVINSALSILSYSPRSEKELYFRLKKKDFEENYIIKAIDYCKDNNYINDREFAELYIRDKFNLNKYGPKKIKYNLLSKGVSKEIIEDLLVLDKEDEYNTALEISLKKVNSYKNDDRSAIYRKLGGFLQRRGYSYDVVRKVLNEILNDMDF